MKIFYNFGGGDEQYTPAYGVEVLIPHIQHLKDKIVWCPFDTEDSEFVKVLRKHGFQVVYSHIVSGQDFFEYEPSQWDVLISNPPYKDKRLFLERAISFGKPFSLLLPINGLSDRTINVVLGKANKDLQLLIPSDRMRFYNATTGEQGKYPSFKAAYFGVGIFKKDVILQDMKVIKSKEVEDE